MHEDIIKRFPELFGTKIIDDRRINVEEIIGTLSEELDQRIVEALAERRKLLESKATARDKYVFPRWNDTFEDPVSGCTRTFRNIVQGLIDNFLGKETDLAWRLNDEPSVPDDAHPLKNPGLELTGPWHPLDMAIKQISADVAAMMGPDDEDAAPADYVPFGATEDRAVGLFASRNNERRLFAGEISEVTVAKKGQPKTYRIEKPRNRWPTSFHRVPGIHLRTRHVTVNGKLALAITVDYVIHALNDYGSLKKAGSGLYYYQPKIQHPSEAIVVAKLVWKLERFMGARKPGTFIKFKALYEEGNFGRFFPVIMWTWRHWLIGTNVGRWDYTGSLIEMWKDERVLPDPQNGALMGMTSPHMMTYQRYNALTNLMAGMKDGKLTNAAPIGGMAAVMLYPGTDPHGRHRHNPVTLRAMKMDKLRERLIGLIFVPDGPPAQAQRVTLADIHENRAEGRLYDAYRQSWVASPDKEYVAAGNSPLRASLEELQSMLDSPEVWEKIDGKPVAPKVSSGLTQDERKSLTSLGLLNENGQITPWVISKEMIDEPEKFFSKTLWGEKDLWESLYDIPEGEITIENIQHAFYMAANYGFQVLNGNLAAAIDDYKIFPSRVVRFMNDLATYRIFVAWLWTVMRLRVRVTKDGFLKSPSLTEDGVIPSADSVKLEAGTTVTRDLFEHLWKLQDEWSRAFFEDFDRLAAIRIIVATIVDRCKQDKFSIHERDNLVDRMVPQILPILSNGLPSKKLADEMATILGVAPSFIEKNIRLIDLVTQVRVILSRAYGEGRSYAKILSYEKAAGEVAKLLEVDSSSALAEIRAAAPRFDRSKAPIIMDLLKRQLLCPLYIQHSPRVLFAIADKDDEQRNCILKAIYYTDEQGAPMFRDEQGRPSRPKLLDAVESHKLPTYALDAHDYVHDILLGPAVAASNF